MTGIAIRANFHQAVKALSFMRYVIRENNKMKGKKIEILKAASDVKLQASAVESSKHILGIWDSLKISKYIVPDNESQKTTFLYMYISNLYSAT